jgi:chemotaxis regulatin CheY-phosphate phosphatase CheZ
MSTTSNGRTLDPLSDLGKDYATLKAIRNLADARKRLSLIAIMAQTAMNRLDGNPGYLWPV